MTETLAGYSFAYLDEQTKRMIRRAILKAIAIPGYQVPFAARVRHDAAMLTGAVGIAPDDVGRRGSRSSIHGPPSA